MAYRTRKCASRRRNASRRRKTYRRVRRGGWLGMSTGVCSHAPKDTVKAL